MELRVEKVTSKQVDRKKVKEIYTSSFLKEDRMPFWMMLGMARLWNTQFLAFYDKDVLCGFLYLAKTKNLVFVMFFAVDETLRSKGYGSQILFQLQKMYPNQKIVISIEPCVEGVQDLKERIRRKQFYLKNGYVESGYFFRMGKKDQEIIIKNGQFSKKEFMLFFIKYSNCTMFPKVWQVT